ncbi:MAG: hypothetical protein AAGJ81_10260 [Verrucomicrobiota bacterium]
MQLIVITFLAVLPPFVSLAAYGRVIFAKTKRGEFVSSVVFTLGLTVTLAVGLGFYLATEYLRGASGEAVRAPSWQILFFSLIAVPVGVSFSLLAVGAKKRFLDVGS